MIVACADSCVDFVIIFNCQPGQLFVVRNVANLIPPCEADDTFHGISAALEFGVTVLEVEHIIILGHMHCGGIQALFNSNKYLKKKHSFIAKWIELAWPAYDKVMAEHAELSLEEKIILCEKLSLINSLHNLQSFPWIRERLKNDKLSLHAWYFDLLTGNIHIYDQHNNWLIL